MLVQFYVHKSHSGTVIMNLAAKNGMGFWLLLHDLLYFLGYTTCLKVISFKSFQGACADCPSQGLVAKVY